MRLLERLALFCLLACLWAGPSLAKEAAFFPYPLTVEKLPNGLSLVLVPYNSPGLVAYYTVVRVGSRNEVEAGHTGFAHFFEHMMFKGTPQNPEGTREAALGKLGFNENAFTSDDVTVYHVAGPSSGLSRLIEFEADRFLHLTYSEATFQTEAKAVLGEYHKNAASPWLKIEETLLAAAFTKHPYGHTTLGYYEDIKKMPSYYEYSKEFFRRWYTPDNTLIYVVGDFQADEVKELVQKYYGPWKGKAARLVIPKEPAQKAPRTATVEWKGATLPKELHAWRTPASTLTSPDGALQNVLGAYLAGPTSPLHKELVLEKQLVESVGSGFQDHRDPYLFSLTATLKDEKNRAQVRSAMEKAVAELAGGKVDDKRLSDVKDNLRYGLLMSLETPSEVALQLAYTAGILGSPNALDAHYRNMAKVTGPQLVAFAKAHLIHSNRTLLTLTTQEAAQ